MRAGCGGTARDVMPHHSDHITNNNHQAHTDLGAWVIGLPFLVAGACDFLGSLLAWLVFRLAPEMTGAEAATAGGSGCALLRACVLACPFSFHFPSFHPDSRHGT